MYKRQALPLGGILIWYIQQPGQILLHDYQLNRVLSFLNPSDYLLTTYNQQYNSIMAIGSGMLTGKGLDNNTITSVKGCLLYTSNAGENTVLRFKKDVYSSEKLTDEQTNATAEDVYAYMLSLIHI